jgi:predicted cobalt transporter CbtA
MAALTFPAVFRAAAVAGVLAGLLLGAFHLAVTEPVIDASIAVEEAAAMTHGEVEEEPVVSREMQRVGLIVGFLLYGLSLGVLFCGAFYLARRLLPDLSAAKTAALHAQAGYWAIALVPAVKYPANPPGVGDPETIQFRQGAALALMVLLLIGAGASLYLRRFGLPLWGVAAANVALAAVLFAVMPANTDPVEMPAGLVTQFRALSIIGLTLFWAVLGALAAWQLRGPGEERPVLREQPAT